MAVNYASVAGQLNNPDGAAVQNPKPLKRPTSVVKQKSFIGIPGPL